VLEHLQSNNDGVASVGDSELHAQVLRHDNFHADEETQVVVEAVDLGS